MLLGRGLGEYPGYYCFDSARPSWLPYFLDDLTESACKYSPKTIAGNIVSCVAGAPDCGTPSAAMQDPTLSGPGVAPAGTSSNMPSCGGFQTFNAETDACELDYTKPSFLLVAGLGLAVVVLPVLLRGGR